jgi:choline kinase
MRAIILAAGKGNRLYPLTESKPKCLLKVKGKSFLNYCLENLRLCGVDDVVIVTGFASKKIDVEVKKLGYNPVLVFNPEFATKNNIVSLWVARDLIKDGFLLINSDVLFHPKILELAVNSPKENFLMLDDTKVLGEEEMKVKAVDGVMLHISKLLNPKESQGEYIGICRFNAAGASAIINALDQLLKENQFDKFYEEAFQRIAPGFRIEYESTKSLPWIEVDNLRDLSYARTKTIVKIQRG